MGLQVKPWTNPSTNAVRYYISTKYPCKYLSCNENTILDRRWIAPDHNGMARTWENGPTGPRTGEDGRMCDEIFKLDGLTYEQFLAIYADSLTKSGNFSDVRWFNNRARA